MSRDNVEVVRGIYAEWGRGNFRAGTDLFDSHVVLVIRADFPDAGAYVGHDEIRAYMRQLLANWTDPVKETLRGARSRRAEGGARHPFLKCPHAPRILLV